MVASQSSEHEKAWLSRAYALSAFSGELELKKVQFPTVLDKLYGY